MYKGSSVVSVNYKHLNGDICLDNNSKPRIWLILYSITRLTNLASSTRKVKLRDITQFYEFCYKSNFDLDKVLVNQDIEIVTKLLEQFYVKLLNYNIDSSYNRVRSIWSNTQSFIDFIHQRLISDSIRINGLKTPEFERKLEYLKNVYSQLKIPSKRYKALPQRALSVNAIEAILSILEIDSELNPFRKRLQKRNYLLVMLMLFLGLRSSECLVLTESSLVLENDRIFLRITYTSQSNNDSRSEKARIKNGYSHRVVPLPDYIYKLLNDYLSTERRSNHKDNKFLFTSNTGKPLHVRQLRYVIEKLHNIVATNFPEVLCENFRDGNLSAHDFRHTAASLLLNIYYEKNKDMTLALQQLREFMGWSPESHMPVRYARLYLQDLANKNAILALDNRLKQMGLNTK